TARQRVRIGDANFTSYEAPARAHGSSAKVTPKSASGVATQILRGPAPFETSFVGGRDTNESEVIATCSGALNSTNSPLPSPPRFSDHVDSRSPSVSAAGTPMPLDAPTPWRMRPIPDGSGVVLGSAAREVAFSRSSLRRRCKRADLKARSFG